MKNYRLAKEKPHAIFPFGPLMTLERAEHYQQEMRRAGFPVLIVNMREGQDSSLFPKPKGNWEKTALLTM